MLVFDRTQEDVDRVIELVAKLANETITEKEKEEYLQGLKGAYNTKDRIRVQNEVQRLSNVLNTLGFTNKVNILNWNNIYFPTKKDDNIYIDNINVLKTTYGVYIDTPSTPNTYFPFQNANNIEKILFDINNLIVENYTNKKHMKFKMGVNVL